MVVVDVQERFRPVVHEWDWMLENIVRLIRGCRVLDVPVVVTEQYPKGLGGTVSEIKGVLGFTPVVKNAFSCFGEPSFNDTLKELGRKNIVLCGIEAHVCVFNTALDALEDGYNVHLAADAVSSRKKSDRRTAVRRMTQEGVRLASVEMLLFQMLKEAGSEEFKKIQEIVK